MLAVEPVSAAELIDRAGPMFHNAWRELASDDQFEPDISLLFSYESYGILRCGLLLEDNSPIGFYILYTVDDLFRRDRLSGRVLVLYCRPDRRSFATAHKLLSAIEQDARAMNCSELVVATRDPIGGPAFGAVLRRFGFSPLEVWHRKPL